MRTVPALFRHSLQITAGMMEAGVSAMPAVQPFREL